MRAVPISEFKDQVSHYVSAAEGGEEIYITRPGQLALRLALAQGDDDMFGRQRRALDRMLKRREELYDQGVRVSAAEIREWIDEDRH